MSTLKVNAISDAAGANGNAITLATDGTCTAKVTNNLSNRNLIINGAMQVAQRSGGSVTANGYQTVDRWYLSAGGTDEGCTQKPTSLGASDAGPFEAGFRQAYQIKNGNQTSGAGAADWVEIQYNIEAQDIACSGWDYTEPTSDITLSFWVKSTVAQTYHCYLQTVDGTAQLYAFSYALSANTWTKVTKTIPGNANLQFDYDTAKGLRIGIVPFYGTDYTSSGFTLNAWAAQSGSSMMPDNTSTWYTTNDAEFELTGVQLEVGSVATDFEHRSFQDEFLRCARYYQEQQGHSDLFMEAGKGQGTTSVDVGHALVVPLRANPTVVLSAHRVFMWDGYSGSSSAPTVTSWDGNHSPHSSVIGLNLPGHSGITNNEVVSWCPHSALLTFSAEL